MNIAFFYHCKMNPYGGGIERVTFNLTREFKARGHKVINVFYRGEEDCAVNFKIPQGVDLAKTAAELDKILIDEKIDFLIDQHGFDEAETHILLKSDVKIIRCIHSDTKSSGHDTALLLRNFNFMNLKESLMNVLFWLNTPRRKYLHDKRLYNQSLGVDRLLLLDEDFYLPKSVDRGKVMAMPNGVTTVEYKLGNKKKQLLFVGRIIHNPKNTKFLAQLWRRLYKEFPDWEFVICGDGQDLPSMKKYADKHNLKRIYFKGVVNPEQFYKDASIVLLPSFYEGFGMVLLEGMQYGCVPVVFDVSSSFQKICKDVNRPEANGSPRDCGVIVKAMDKKAYINECRKLMQDENLRRKLGEAAIEHVKDYDLEKITDRWEALFEELMTEEPSTK